MDDAKDAKKGTEKKEPPALEEKKKLSGVTPGATPRGEEVPGEAARARGQDGEELRDWRRRVGAPQEDPRAHHGAGRVPGEERLQARYSRVDPEDALPDRLGHRGKARVADALVGQTLLYKSGAFLVVRSRT